MNPAREALTRAVNKAIASGAPIITEQAPRMIRVDVRGVAGEASATFPYFEWLGMAAAARVLALHDKCRPALQGKPFDVVRTHVA